MSPSLLIGLRKAYLFLYVNCEIPAFAGMNVPDAQLARIKPIQRTITASSHRHSLRSKASYNIELTSFKRLKGQQHTTT
jgi:hypothetical protein